MQKKKIKIKNHTYNGIAEVSEVFAHNHFKLSLVLIYIN